MGKLLLVLSMALFSSLAYSREVSVSTQEGVTQFTLPPRNVWSKPRFQLFNKFVQSDQGQPTIKVKVKYPMRRHAGIYYLYKHFYFHVSEGVLVIDNNQLKLQLKDTEFVLAHLEGNEWLLESNVQIDPQVVNLEKNTFAINPLLKIAL